MSTEPGVEGDLARQYWIDLFTGKTWDEFIAAGGRTSGHRASKSKMVKRIKPGDWLLCYVTGVSRFIAVLEVEGEALLTSRLSGRTTCFLFALRSSLW